MQALALRLNEAGVRVSKMVEGKHAVIFFEPKTTKPTHEWAKNVEAIIEDRIRSFKTSRDDKQKIPGSNNPVTPLRGGKPLLIYKNHLGVGIAHPDILQDEGMEGVKAYSVFLKSRSSSGNDLIHFLRSRL